MHGTCVALGNAGALLRGSCGSGKSDLALRFLYLPSDRLGEEAALVADDQVILRRDGDDIVASCPEASRWKDRGARLRYRPASEGGRAQATLKLIVDLDWTGDRPRFPEKTEWERCWISLSAASSSTRLSPRRRSSWRWRSKIVSKTQWINRLLSSEATILRLNVEGMGLRIISLR